MKSDNFYWKSFNQSTVCVMPPIGKKWTCSIFDSRSLDLCSANSFRICVGLYGNNSVVKSFFVHPALKFMVFLKFYLNINYTFFLQTIDH